MDGTNTIADLRRLFGSLSDLAAALGLSLSLLQAGETADTLLFEGDVEALSLSGVALEILQSGVKCWNNSLTVSLTSDYGIRPLTAGPLSVDPNSFAQFKTDLAAARAGDKVRVSLRLDKRYYFRHSLQPVAGVHLLLYIFRSNVIRALAGEFSEVQQIFFPEVHSRCICLLLEDDCQLSGTYLAIVGPGTFWAECARKAKLQSRQRIDSVSQTRAEQVSWIDFDTHLTPYHLMLPVAVSANQDLSAALARKFYSLAVIHLAESVRRVGNDYIASFGGAARVAVHLPLEVNAVPGNTATLARLFMWAYSEKAPDKLPFVRSVTASILTDDPRKNYEVFAEALPRIFVSTRSNYASYIQGFVTRHFEKLREVDGYVREIGNRLGDQVSDLAKNLTTSMLGTVGVVVGGFVTYALNPKVTPKVLSTGLLLYGAYIVAFPLVYFLIFHNLLHYVITVRDFDKRVEEFELALHLPGLSKKLTDNVRWRKAHFWFLFVISCLAFLGLAWFCYRMSAYLNRVKP
jgi:hypothetical protein